MANLTDYLSGSDWSQYAQRPTLHTPLGTDVLLAETVRIDETLNPVSEHTGCRIELTALSCGGVIPLTALPGQHQGNDFFQDENAIEIIDECLDNWCSQGELASNWCGDLADTGTCKAAVHCIEIYAMSRRFDKSPTYPLLMRSHAAADTARA